MKRLKYLLPIILVSVMAHPAKAAYNQWSGSGPYETGLGNRVIKAIAVSQSGNSVYAGTGSGTVHNYSYGFRLTVTIPAADSVIGTGQVVSTPSGISCSSGGTGVCSATYTEEGAPVTLTATTAIDSTFDGWSLDCSGVAPCILAMTSDKNVTANFGRGPDSQGPVARIGSTGYSTLNDAYNAAGSSGTILLLAGDHVVGVLKMNQGKDIIMKGGYNAFFTIVTGLPSVLLGNVSIDSGSLRVNRIKVKPSN